MKHIKLIVVALMLVLVTGFPVVRACTNVLVTKGASTDGSTMISYAADSHVLYGELYFWPAAEWQPGAMLKVWEWDTGKYLGEIPQALRTYRVVGNMNEYQVSIAETTYGGREELADSTGMVDYGSLIYVALQRSKTAREAIKVMTELVTLYGYYSTGESFSIADANEVWIMEMIGKGTDMKVDKKTKANYNANKGAVWVAIRIPDGYISGHANQARIQTFTYQKKNLWDDPNATVFNSADVISFAKAKGYFKGEDKDFSFSDTYAPVDFGSARFSEARVWSFFRKANKEMDKYQDYAMGKNLTNRMPLFIKPDHKISVQEVMSYMRDFYGGTPMDMTQDVGAGPYGNPYRWRPLTYKVDGQMYFNERAVVTQQTGFSHVSQMRSWMPREVGGIFWFSVDDNGTSVFTPIYSISTKVPRSYAKGFGSMMEFNPDAAFWVFNQVSNFVYTRYSDMQPEVKAIQDETETKYVAMVADMDAKALEALKTDNAAAVQMLTDFSVNTAEATVARWKQLYGYLFTKYMDGNIKWPNGNEQNPNIKQPGYGEKWNRMIIEKTGDHLKYEGAGH